MKIAQDLPPWDRLHISRISSPASYADGLSEGTWTHWGTFTWRPRTSMVATEQKDHAPTGHIIARYDKPETAPRTTLGQQVDPISLPAVRRAVGRWCYRIKPSAIWWATEPGGRFGRHHIHMLCHLTPKAMERKPWGLAFQWFGRSEIEEYDPGKGAAHYVGKYVTKELSDHDFWTRRTGYRS